MDETTKFEGFAKIEIMGHQSAAGYVTTEAFGSVVMFHVVTSEVPSTETVLESNQYINGELIYAGSRVRFYRERRERFIGAASIYQMHPCTEEEALKMQPVKVEVLERAAPKMLPSEPIGYERQHAPLFHDDDNRENGGDF